MHPRAINNILQLYTSIIQFATVTFNCNIVDGRGDHCICYHAYSVCGHKVFTSGCFLLERKPGYTYALSKLARRPARHFKKRGGCVSHVTQGIRCALTRREREREGGGGRFRMLQIPTCRSRAEILGLG